MRGVLVAKRAILLVTGSRAYPGGPRVFDMVRRVVRDFASRHAGKELVLMHGDCPHPKRSSQQALSIDQVAASVGEYYGFRIEPRPADWDKYRRLGRAGAAGPVRNTGMVDELVEEREAGADVEVAGFPYGEARNEGLPEVGQSGWT